MVSYLKIPITIYDRIKKELSKDFEYSDSRRSCYELLGIKEGCSIEELKSAYRKMIKIYHPDKLNSVDLNPMIKEDLLKKAKEIQRAYESIKEWENLS
ncbi:DnaJ domain-containing protein [Turicibacter sanguinis]|uniref:J domain-containing protein n=1 Tax=Turicibacter sanguinis TaxID=154288 RepID=UPI002942799E|nr:DnaJ domain-containing protein [Turicibacter sanguinis]